MKSRGAMRLVFCVAPIVGVAVLAGAAGARVSTLTPDPAFGYQGNAGVSHAGQGALAIQPDGKILLGGHDAQDKPAVARLLPNGTLDSSFGNGGYADIPCGCLAGPVTAMAVDSSGRIVIAGKTQYASWYVGRLTASGSGVDTSFDAGSVNEQGWVYAGAADVTFPNWMGIDGAGTIYLGGISGHQAVAAYNPDGSAGGWATGVPSSVGTLVQSNGTVYVTDLSNPNELGVYKILPGGGLDLSYGTSGAASASFPDAARAQALAQLSDGSIVVVGVSGDTSSPDGYWSGSQQVVAARFNTNGTLDTSWGNGGTVAIPVANPLMVKAAAAEPNGNVAVLGQMLEGQEVVPYILEIGANGAVATPATPALQPGAQATAMAVAPDGSLVVSADEGDTGAVVQRILTGSSSGGGSSGGGGASSGAPTGSGLPDLQLTLTSGATNAPAVGSQLAYSVTVGDKPGTGGSYNVTATVNLPPGFTVAKTYSDRGKGCAGTTSPLVCDLDWISPSVVGHITIWGTVGTAGPLTVSATVTEGPGELNPADNSATLVLKPVAPAAPALKASKPPMLTGTPVPGSTLVATGPRWNAAPSSVSYQWELCLGSRCAPIHGATTLRLKLLAGYVGYGVRLVATATNAAGKATGASAQLRVRKRR